MGRERTPPAGVGISDPADPVLTRFCISQSARLQDLAREPSQRLSDSCIIEFPVPPIVISEPLPADAPGIEICDCSLVSDRPIISG
jgi:hypothetical protein